MFIPRVTPEYYIYKEDESLTMYLCRIYLLSHLFARSIAMLVLLYFVSLGRSGNKLFFLEICEEGKIVLPLVKKNCFAIIFTC